MDPAADFLQESLVIAEDHSLNIGRQIRRHALMARAARNRNDPAAEAQHIMNARAIATEFAGAKNHNP